MDLAPEELQFLRIPNLLREAISIPKWSDLICRKWLKTNLVASTTTPEQRVKIML
jgi:hypothetical protein